jgi:hypothetical protein
LLSAATAALLAGPAYADATCTTVADPNANPYCITTDTTTALTTGAAETGGALERASIGDANKGSIYIVGSRSTTTDSTTTTSSAGSLTISTAGVGAITVNSNSYVYSDGTITNEKAGTNTNGTTTTYATGILVDVHANPDASALSFINNADTTTITGAGIYMDSASYLYLTGSGTSKRGIWLNAANGTGTYTGDITFISGSTTQVDGDSSVGILIDSGATLKGDLTIGGGVSVSQTTAGSKTVSDLYGIYMGGEVDGNIKVTSAGSISMYGTGAQGIKIVGSGVTGSLTIDGSVVSSVSTSTSTSSYYSTSSSTTYPEASYGLAVGSSIGGGIEIGGAGFSDDSTATGSVKMNGDTAAVYIDPTLPNLSSTALTTPTQSLTIGVYADTYDPGFSFYNRGTVAAAPNNYNTKNTIYAMQIVGDTSYPTLLTGGIYNSGSISASSSTNGDTADANAVTALHIGDYVYVGAASYAAEQASLVKYSTDLASLVNTGGTGSGTISAAVSGTRGGEAKAIYVAPTARLSSIINSGTISATASTTKTDIADDLTTTTEIANILKATAIQDDSGTLTSIYNSGTISAGATTLDADISTTRRAFAIDLSATVSGMDAYNGVTITSKSATSAASITGDILFGDGSNQQIYVLGAGSSYASTISGNIHYGTSTIDGIGNGDLLSIGSWGVVSGKVTADSGVEVQIANNGFLYLTNESDVLKASNFTVESGGHLNIGVNSNSSLADSGIINASGTVAINKGANLGANFDSYITSRDYVLIKTTAGKLTVADLALYSHAISTPASEKDGAMPYLFASASLTCTNCDTAASDYNPSGSSELVLTVRTKEVGTGADQLPLTGYAAQLFDPANVALTGDDTLGAAMVNGIKNAAEAQAAYNSFAPNVTGGSRAIAISVTDQATGVVGARQRMLNLYGKQEGGTTLWSQEFFQTIKDPGQGAPQADGTKEKSGFKDHGFGFALGIDGGSPKYGWYGGALTFYAGDVGELTRNSHTNEQWYILSGYSAWRGKGLFFDSKIDAGFGHFDGKRTINLTVTSGTSAATYTREADNTHTGIMLSGGFTTGGIFSYGAATLAPQISVDGLLMRESGYLEFDPSDSDNSKKNGSDGFDLKVGSYSAKSLRIFLGGSVRYDLDLWDFYLQPEAHTGFRYDVFNDPMQLKAAFKDVNAATAGNQNGTEFTVTGPDPSRGNYVLGGSLAATTDTWTLGLNFDLVRGTNGAFEQVGTINLLGRI